MNPLWFAIGTMFGSGSGPINFVPMTHDEMISLIFIIGTAIIGSIISWLWIHRSIKKNPDLWLPRRSDW